MLMSKLRFCFKIHLLVHAMMFASAPIFSQGIKQEILHSNFRFNASIGQSMQNHFDGNPMVEWNELRTSDNITGKGFLDVFRFFNNGVVLSLGTNLDSVLGLKLEYNGIYTEHPSNCFQCGERGDIFLRHSRHFSIVLNRSFHVSEKFRFYPFLCLVYRRGSELVVAGYGWFDTLVLSRIQSDIGFRGGLTLERLFYKNCFGINFTVSQNEFLHRYDRGQRSNYTWDNGTMRRMLSFSFSMNYYFAQRK